MTTSFHPSHQCPGPDCEAEVPRTQLACPRHWAQVHKATQRKVYATYDSRDRLAHLRAMDEAIGQMRP
jgi:hypothetical protein